MPECPYLLEGDDLATLDEAKVAALYEELQEPELPDEELDFSRWAVDRRVRPYCSFFHQTRPPEFLLLILLKNPCLSLSSSTRPCAKVSLGFAAMTTTTQVAEINLQPSQARDYSAYVPIWLGNLTTAAFIDSSNTFSNVISPQTMTAPSISTAQLEPVPQLSVGTAAAGKRMKILGQAHRIDLQLRQHPAKFRIRPLVLQGLVHPVNICGPFLARAGIDQIHSQGVLRVCSKDVPMCPPRQPSSSSKLPPPQPTLQVCTLHVPEASVPRQQYTPRGPSLEACLGSAGAKIPGISHAVLSPAAPTSPLRRHLGVDTTCCRVTLGRQPYTAGGTEGREPLGPRGKH